MADDYTPAPGHHRMQCFVCKRLMGPEKDKPNPGKLVKASHYQCARCAEKGRRRFLRQVQKLHPERKVDIPKGKLPPDTGESTEEYRRRIGTWNPSDREFEHPPLESPTTENE